MDDQAKRVLGSELAKVPDTNLKAFRDKDKVIFVIQDAPEELRRLADALERINVRELQAIVAFRPQEPPAARSAE